MKPTREQVEVDEALGHAETLAEMLADGSRTAASILPSEMNLLVLADEVKVLRAKLEDAAHEFAKLSLLAALRERP